MKKTCDNCRAYESGGYCSLDYKVDKIYYGGIGGPVIGAIPMEECPKPRTITQLIYECQKRIKYQ